MAPRRDRPAPTSTGTEDVRGAPGRIRIKRCRIEVVSGPDRGITRLSEGKRFVIGSHRSADLVLRDRTVSRFHCEVQIGERGVVLVDLGSRNGTAVDGVPVLSAPLREQAMVTVGQTTLQLDASGRPAELIASERQAFGGLIGRSPAMRELFSILERAAASDATVLLQGETGTGKDLAAEALHAVSPRCEGPFVVVDCGALPAELLEAELFGYERGAFTGATSARRGALEAASGGTLFFDEIGELGADLQPKLLRALEQRQIKRVGGDRPIPVDVRVLAATNRDLRAEVNAGRFRSDLYFRLAVVQVHMPPLRERPQDILPLIEHWLAGEDARRRPGAELLLREATLAQLRRHGWPGNVRELKNYVERCLLFHEPQPLEGGGGDPTAVDTTIPLKTARELWTQRFERRYLEALLAQHGDSAREAARVAGVDRAYFYRLLWRHGLR